jgi:hypothetical protein
MSEQSGGSNPPLFITRDIVWFTNLLERENFRDYLHPRQYVNKEGWEDLIEKIKSKITTEKPENIYFDSETIFPVRSWRHKKECPVVIKKRPNTTIVINNNIFPTFNEIEKDVIKELTINGHTHYVDIVLDSNSKGNFKTKKEKVYTLSYNLSLDYYESLLKEERLITVESLLSHFPMSEKVEVETFAKIADLVMSKDLNLNKAGISMLSNLCPYQNTIESFAFLNVFRNYFRIENIGLKYLKAYFQMERFSNRPTHLNKLYNDVRYLVNPITSLVASERNKIFYETIVQKMYDSDRKNRNKKR